jgi:hypothetical protein
MWHPTVFTKNHDRLLEGAVAEEFFSIVVEQARRKKFRGYLGPSSYFSE